MVFVAEGSNSGALLECAHILALCSNSSCSVVTDDLAPEATQRPLLFGADT